MAMRLGQLPLPWLPSGWPPGRRHQSSPRAWSAFVLPLSAGAIAEPSKG